MIEISSNSHFIQEFAFSSKSARLLKLKMAFYLKLSLYFMEKYPFSKVENVSVHGGSH